MEKARNEKGLTLVEVLAAVVILSIVFVGIMTIFPQMTLFNNKTEAKLDTMNLARQEMASILLASKWEKVLVSSATDATALEPEFLSKEKIDYELADLGFSKQSAESLESLPYTSGSYVRYKKEGIYHYVVDVYLQCEPFLLKETSTSGPETKVPCAQEDQTKLYKTHLKVYNNKNTKNGSYQLSSETYSYIRYIAKKPSATSGGG